MHVELVDGKQIQKLFILTGLQPRLIYFTGSAVCRLPASGITFRKAHLLLSDPDGDAIVYFQRVIKPGPVCLKLLNLKKAVPHRPNLNPFAADLENERYRPNAAGVTPRYWLITGYQITRGNRTSSSSASTGRSSRLRPRGASTKSPGRFQLRVSMCRVSVICGHPSELLTRELLARLILLYSISIRGIGCINPAGGGLLATMFTNEFDWLRSARSTLTRRS